VIEGLGWLATAAFCASYFVRRQRTMLLVQVTAALLWVGYGAFTRAAPVVVANVVVALSATLALRRPPPEVRAARP
jgi:hypothetical protein